MRRSAAGPPPPRSTTRAAPMLRRPGVTTMARIPRQHARRVIAWARARLARPRLRLPALPRARLALRRPRLPIRPPTPRLPRVPAAAVPAPTSSADDRAQVVAEALARLWAEHGITSPLLALDTPAAGGRAPVVVTIDAAPADEAALAALPAQLAARPGWRAAWHAGALTVEPPDGAAPAPGGPLLIPLLDYGRRRRMTRAYPLSAWRHLGLYGADTHGALHALLGHLLSAQPPAALALAVLDRGEVAPLYRAAPHLVAPPGPPDAVVERLGQALRRGAWARAAAAQPPAPQPIRPLLLVVVEPDEALLEALGALLPRLLAQPAAPLHLLLVQERLRPAGRELYAALPALLTPGGQGAPHDLPGRGGWPPRGTARLVARGVRCAGRPRALDEATLAARLARLAPVTDALPPTLWDAPVAPSPTTAAPAPDAPDDPRHLALLARLDALLAAPAPAAPAPDEPDEPDGGWPAGPLGLRPRDLAALLRQIATDPSTTAAAQADQVGLTKRRLQGLGIALGLFPEPQARPLAAALLAWFDAAGILADPLTPKLHRLSQPRALRTADLGEIAARLSATPAPDDDAVRAAFAPPEEGQL